MVPRSAHDSIPGFGAPRSWCVSSATSGSGEKAGGSFWEAEPTKKKGQLDDFGGNCINWITFVFLPVVKNSRVFFVNASFVFKKKRHPNAFFSRRSLRVIGVDPDPFPFSGYVRMYKVGM